MGFAVLTGVEHPFGLVKGQMWGWLEIAYGAISVAIETENCAFETLRYLQFWELTVKFEHIS